MIGNTNRMRAIDSFWAGEDTLGFWSGNRSMIRAFVQQMSAQINILGLGHDL